MPPASTPAGGIVPASPRQTRPRGQPPAEGDTCRNGHPYGEGSHSWQRNGAGYLYIQCNRCNAERRAGKPRGRPRRVGTGGAP